MANVLQSVRKGLSASLVAPVREGTFAQHGGSSSLQGVTILSSIIFAGLLVAIVAAPAIRSASALISAPSSNDLLAIPSFLVPGLLAALAFSFSLVLTAAVRSRLLLAVPLAVGVLLLQTVIVAAGSSSAIDARPPWEGYGLVLLACVAAICARRWRGSVLRDLLAFNVLLLATAIVCQRSFTTIATESGVRVDVATVALILTFVTTLALPLSVASGVGAVDASLGVVMGLTRGVVDVVPRSVTALLAILLLAWQWWLTVSHALVEGRPVSWVTGAAVLGSSALIWFACRVPGDHTIDVALARATSSRWSLPVSYGLASVVICGGAIGLIALAIHLATGLPADSRVAAITEALLGTGGISAARIAVLVFLGVAGYLLRAKGRSLAAAVAWIDAILIASYSLAATSSTSEWWPWTTDALADVGTVVVTGMAAIVVARKPSRWRSTAVPLVLCLSLVALMRRADVLSAPITLVVGSSVTAALVVGLAWGFLTDGALAQGASDGPPKQARVLLILGNFTFTAAVVAWAVLGLQPQPYEDLQAATALGVQTLGSAVLIVVAFVVTLQRTGVPVTAPFPRS